VKKFLFILDNLNLKKKNLNFFGGGGSHFWENNLDPFLQVKVLMKF
jgi:hypothetical protein